MQYLKGQVKLNQKNQSSIHHHLTWVGNANLRPPKIDVSGSVPPETSPI